MPTSSARPPEVADMTMHVAPQRTGAETALLEAYDRRLTSLPGNEAVMLKRDQAIERLKQGLPTRRSEAWHYTDLRRLLATVPEPEAGTEPKPLPPLAQGSTALILIDGHTQARLPAIEGVTLQRLEDKLADGSFAAALEPRDDADAIGSLNAAFVADGYFLDIQPGAKPPAPIELQNLNAGGQAHVRLPVRVGAGAAVTIVERQAEAGAGLSTSVSHLLVREGAEVRWLIVQEQSEAATHLGQFNAELGRNSRLMLFVMNAGGRLVRQEVRVAAKGDGADFQLRGINLLAGDSHTDLTMVLDHIAPGTGSRELVRNVVTGKARGVFQGRINVHQKAQKTDARMACNTLLLSDDGEFSTKPELEIFADDVQCGHGATVTEIDRSHLFYLMARGIEEKTARGMLIKAFLAEVVEQLDHEALVEALASRLDDWFAAHG